MRQYRQCAVVSIQLYPCTLCALQRAPYTAQTPPALLRYAQVSKETYIYGKETYAYMANEPY